jgi:hypothetical protein
MSITTTPGIVLEINGANVPLAPSGVISAVTDLRLTGVTYTLPQPVSLGSVADLSGFLSDQFGAPALPDPAGFPAPLDSIYEKVITLVFGVEQASVTVPPSKKKDSQNQIVDIPANEKKAVSFDLGLTGTWPPGEEVEIIPGKLKVKGLFLRIVKDNVP